MLHELEHTLDGAGIGGLPDGSFDRALASFLGTTHARLLAMYAGHRARFAQFLVAELLPGAVVERDPETPWHVFWPVVPGTPIRITVICSGAYDPTAPDQLGPTVWEIPPARRRTGHTDERVPLDALVLARHDGTDVQTGWTFRIARAGTLPSGRLSARHLDGRGIPDTSAAQLAVALLGHLHALV